MREVPISRSHIEDQVAALLYAWGYANDDEDIQITLGDLRKDKEHVMIKFTTSKRTD